MEIERRYRSWGGYKGGKVILTGMDGLPLAEDFN
jgi:hypothetical protein